MKTQKIKTGIICFVFLVAATSSLGLAQSTTQTPNNRGSLNYDPHGIDYGAFQGHPILNTTFEVWAGAGCCTLTYWFNWTQTFITVYPLGGTSDGEHDTITVTIDTTSLPVGHYALPIEVNSDQGNGLFWVNFSIVLYNVPTLQVTPDVADFGFVPNGGNASLFLSVQNVGTGVVNYTIQESCPWLTIDSDRGTTNGDVNYVNVTVYTEGLPPQIYQTSINFYSNGGNITVPVILNLTGLKITGVKTTDGLITAHIVNVGNCTVDELHWKIIVKGGILKHVNFYTLGALGSVGPGADITFGTIRKVFGFGKVTITIYADYSKTLQLKGAMFFNDIKILS